MASIQVRALARAKIRPRRRQDARLSGSRRRKRRGRTTPERCLRPVGPAMMVDAGGRRVPGAVPVCGEVLRARRGWLRCPVHG